MCEFASFFHNPATSEVKVAVLDSHAETENKLGLDPKVWREGHYTPRGKIELRFTEDDRVDKVEYENAFKNRFPTFIGFFNWAIEQIGEKYGGWLDLSGLTSAQGLKLPQEIGGSLDLSGLTSAQGLKLPQEIGGWLDLSGLTSAQGLKLPQKIGGWLYLSSKVRVELKGE